MTVTIRANNTSVTVADASSILVTGTGDTVSTNSSTITFNPAGSLTVSGTGDTINLQTPGSTLNLAGTGATNTVTVAAPTTGGIAKPPVPASDPRRVKQAACQQRSFSCEWPRLSEGIKDLKKALFGSSSSKDKRS